MEKKSLRSRSVSLRATLFIVFSITMVALVVATSLVSYAKSRSAIIEEAGKARVGILRQIGERTRDIKGLVSSVFDRFYADDALNAVVRGELPFQEGTKLLEQLYAQYVSVYESAGVPFECTVIAENGFAFHGGMTDQGYTFSELTKHLWYARMLAHDSTYWMGGIDGYSSERRLLTAVRAVKDADGTAIALLIINIDERLLYKAYESSLDQWNNVYIIDENGTFISHRDPRYFMINYYDIDKLRELLPEDSYQIISKAGKEYLFSNYYDRETGWTMIEEYPAEILLSGMQAVLRSIIVSMAIGVAGALLITFFVTRAISRPVQGVCDAMALVQDGRLEEIAEVDHFSELRKMQDAFNWMVANVRRLLEQQATKEREKREAEISFLQAQISPHFISNTLMSIKCMVAIGQYEKAQESMGAFIQLLSLSLMNNHEMIRMADEVAYLTQYTLIQQNRTGNRFQIEFEVEEEAQDCLLPRLILQPLVENAIIHGIDALGEEGNIALNAYARDGFLNIIVSDNGVGMSEQACAAFARACEDEPAGGATESNHIGLQNVQRRIRLYYGGNCGLQVHASGGRGTSILVRIPDIRDGKE